MEKTHNFESKKVLVHTFGKGVAEVAKKGWGGGKYQPESIEHKMQGIVIRNLGALTVNRSIAMWKKGEERAWSSSAGNRERKGGQRGKKQKNTDGNKAERNNP